MTDAPSPLPAAPPEPDLPAKKRRGWFGPLVIGLLLLGGALAVGAVRWLDSAAGHRFVLERIAAWRPASGLRVEIGAIEGSIYRRFTLRDVRFADPQGGFARIETAEMQWYPLAWFSNRLDIDALHIGQAMLDRRPALISTGQSDAILPDFDIRLMDLKIDHLALGEAVVGAPHVLSASGRADIRNGRAIIDLEAAARDGEDRLRFSIDSRPDEDRFNIDVAVTAPAGGIIGGLAGMREPMALTLKGSGTWSRWHGGLTLDLGGRTALDLALEGQKGRYHLQGPIALIGSLAALGSGTADLEADLDLEGRRLGGEASLTRPGLTLEATGGIDLGRARFDELRFALRADDPGRLVSGLAGRPVDIKARLSGPFRDAAFDLLATAPELRQGDMVLTALKLDAQGRLKRGGGSWRVKLAADALRTGASTLDGRLRQLAVQTDVQLAGGQLRFGPATLRGSGLTGRMDGQADLRSGALALTLDARMAKLEIAGLGQLDLDATLQLARRAGAQLALTGRARAALLRLDNGFLRGLAGGLPVVASDLALGSGGTVMLDNLALSAPALSLAGRGTRVSNGAVHIEATGAHNDYGPLALTLDGAINRPTVDLQLARPGQGLGLAEVAVRLDPNSKGYAISGHGQSMLGPFTAQGDILLPQGGEARIDVEAVRLGDVLARGTLVPMAGGLEGTLALTGPANGIIVLTVPDTVQRVALDVDLGQARFAGPLGLSVNRGRVQAQMSLQRRAIGLEGEVEARGVRYGSVRIGQLGGTVSLVNGAGTARLSVSAQNRRAFDITAQVDVTPDRLLFDLSGRIERQPVRLATPAMLMRESDGWRLRPARMLLGEGGLELSAFWGVSSTHIDARLAAMPLALLDLVDADLGLGGSADGTLVYDQPRGGVPAGKLSMRVRGLTRSGLALSSAPIDIGINAALDDQRAAVRAVIAEGGAVTGRAQALLTPLGPGSLMERLQAAPLEAQLHYSGSADTLWRLSNIELLALGGEVEIEAQARGTMADPTIKGTLAARNASLQSPATGMALSQITASGAFDGAGLNLSSITGRTARNGTVTGTARFTFSGTRGIGMDVALQADRAVLLDRDDVGATVTGPLRLQSDGGAGTISGDLDIVASRFMLGRASSVAEIPRIRLIEINRRGEEVAPTRISEPWRLDIRAKARRGLQVEGLGMQSEWAADLVISGPVTTPQFRGTATLIDGSYDFAGKRFDLEEGRLSFTGASPVNPALDIRAVADVEDLNATISVTGSSLRPVVTMSSIPALPQDELLSRLLFGTSITNLSAPEALQLASAVAAFQGNNAGLDPINALRRATGLSRLRVLPADATTGQGTAIAAGKNIGRLYVELISDGQGYSATRIEFQITRWLSLLSSVSSVGRQSASVRVSTDY